MIRDWEKKSETHCLWCESIIPWKDEKQSTETKDGFLCIDCQQIELIRKRYYLDG